MKILHIVLACVYTDGFTYQENLLSKYHKRLGYDVEIITYRQVYDEKGAIVDYTGPSVYTDENGVRITRLSFRSPKKLYVIMRRHRGLMNALIRSAPDIVFIHGCQFLDMDVVVKYLKKHPVSRVYVDNHADFYNSARNALSRRVLHGVIWKHEARLIEPYAAKFYGVVPLRVDFLKEMYGLPAEKCELLEMGVDDDAAQKALAPGVRETVRTAYGVSDGDFVILTGGKINAFRPQVITLMKAVNSMDDRSVRLVVFGSVDPGLKEEFDAQLSDSVKYIGWRSAGEIYSDFAAADLVVFPGLHSVLWEQAVGMGKPCVFKRIEGYGHIDLGGNCLFFEKDTAEEYKRMLSLARERIDAMTETARQKGRETFSYLKIAERAVR